jgi:hypothetical protein
MARCACDARFAVAPRDFDKAPSGTDRLRGLPLYGCGTDQADSTCFRIMRSVRQ